MKSLANPDSPQPSPRQIRRFVGLAIAFAVLYGVWAAALGFRIVICQQAVRQHLWFALRERPRGAFPDDQSALTVATQWVAELNAVYHTNPCAPGPAFRLLRSGAGARWTGPACTVVVGVRHHHVVVHAYDTQGYRMDDAFQRLHPPPRRL
ncbi:MAG: hypothetical protein M0Z76_06135 [Gammaproteobacteria bacterium]|nr:hypothetical protein [Gammaproteobacteria bacterium]